MREIFPTFKNRSLFCRTENKNVHGILWQPRKYQWDGKQIIFSKYYRSHCKEQPTTIKTVEAHFFHITVNEYLHMQITWSFLFKHKYLKQSLVLDSILQQTNWQTYSVCGKWQCNCSFQLSVIWLCALIKSR